jgi:hypothetical protein
MQRDAWTFDGATEVTVNIFSMHANMFMLGRKLEEIEWLRNQSKEFVKYFRKNPNYHDWQNNFGMALVTFAQLIKHFGWQSMYTFMKNYEQDIEMNSSNLPSTNQEKIDQWVIRYSLIVSRNIKPQFRMFGLPVSSSVDEQLSHLEPWCIKEETDPKIFFGN